MRRLVERFSMNEGEVIQEYAAAERRGEMKRKSNEHGMSSEAYARALWRDGVRDAVRKGWLR
jgi:hypothetical protein